MHNLNLRLVRNRHRRQQMQTPELNLPRELEQMFQVLHDAWESAESDQVQVRIPPELSHLTWDQWERAAHLLQMLQLQQELHPLQ